MDLDPARETDDFVTQFEALWKSFESDYDRYWDLKNLLEIKQIS
jgi:hypothetical protein